MLKNRPDLTTVYVDDKVTLLSSMIIELPQETLYVPKGYKTDLVTVPESFDYFFNRRYVGNFYIYAAILHDYILETGYRLVLVGSEKVEAIRTTRHAGDYYFLIALLALGVRRELAYSMYVAVWIYSEAYLQRKRWLG